MINESLLTTSIIGNASHIYYRCINPISTGYNTYTSLLIGGVVVDILLMIISVLILKEVLENYHPRSGGI